MPVPEGGRRTADRVIFFVAYKTKDDVKATGELGVFNSLDEAQKAISLLAAEPLSWEFYADGVGDMWFAETKDETMYTIHAAARTRLQIN